MTVAIIGFKEEDYSKLCEKMEELISSSQFFLFNVLISSFGSVAHKWAEEFGAPVQVLKKVSIDEIVKHTDYLVCNYDGSPQMHELIFKFMRTGKHGTVIEKEKWS